MNCPNCNFEAEEDHGIEYIPGRRCPSCTYLEETPHPEKLSWWGRLRIRIERLITSDVFDRRDERIVELETRLREEIGYAARDHERLVDLEMKLEQVTGGKLQICVGFCPECGAGHWEVKK